ncbi:hypothetical protein JOC37_001824 [Desulfohalotomaculum tongense]|nr:hypothetical protein [Desulforadius tongensis]MBM7855429.1 hypothetical protein [Desulforadius tongensis]
MEALVVIKTNIFVYRILHLFGCAERVQIETFCLEMAEEVFHAGIVQTVSLNTRFLLQTEHLFAIIFINYFICNIGNSSY